MSSEENRASDPVDPDYTEYQGAAESVELSESVDDGDLPDDLTDNEHQDAELSERIEKEISDYFLENPLDREHHFRAFQIYKGIMLEHRGRSTSQETRMTVSSELANGFLYVLLSCFGRVINPAISPGARDQAIDNLLIPAPADETQAESEPCPICDETFEATTEDGKSLANHEACMLPNCKHVFGRKCIDAWLKEEEKDTCPMCRAKIELPLPYAISSLILLRALMVCIRQ